MFSQVLKNETVGLGICEGVLIGNVHNTLIVSRQLSSYEKAQT